MTFAELHDKVAAQRTVISSAATLLSGLKTKLDEAIASGDPAEIQKVSDEIGANTDALSSAIQTNTPATPTPTP